MYYFCFAALKSTRYVAGIHSKCFVTFQQCLNASGGVPVGTVSWEDLYWLLACNPFPSFFRKPMRIAVLHQPAQPDNPKTRQILSSPEIVRHQHLQHHRIPKQMATVWCRITMLSLLLQGPEMRSPYQTQCMEFCFSPGKRWSRSSKVGLPSS